jgi:hypothetical protein
MRHMGLPLEKTPFKWRHLSLHDIGYGKYGDKFRGESWDGIEFHPTYEGRMWRYLRTHAPLAQDDSVGFWIVGGEGRPAVCEPFYTHEVTP